MGVPDRSRPNFTAAFATSVLAAALGMLPLGAAGRGADVRHLASPARRAPEIRVPPGFRAEVYASGLRRPTAIAWSPRGQLFATQETGEVVRVRPRRVVARGFRTPLGLAWKGRMLSVSSAGTLWLIRRGRRRAILSGLPYGRHQQDNVVVGRDGRLYLGSGSTCDACLERSRLSAAVLSVAADGTGLHVVAHGLRNPYGLAVDAATGRLYASVNARDDLGPWEPAESIVEIRPGRNFGWPSCWPSWRRRRLAGRCRGVTEPVAYLEPHSAPAGLVVYRGRSFPPAYRGDLFVAEWGTYSGRVHGRRVVRVDPASGRVFRFATGFDHPVAVAVDLSGALLVADHGRGVVYRIQARGKA